MIYIFYLQKEQRESKKLMKGASFKLNLHPTAYFDSNPYQASKGLKVYIFKAYVNIYGVALGDAELQILIYLKTLPR